VVVNHALFFLDLASGGALLPAYDFVILDEAHQAEKYATAALTATLSPVSVHRMMRKLHRTYAIPGAYDAELDEGMRRLQQTLAQVPGDKYPGRRERGPGRRLAGDARNVLPARELAARELEGCPAQTDRQRGRGRAAARSGAALGRGTRRDGRSHRARGAAGRQSGAVPADEIDAVAWVERGEGGERYEVNAAPFTVADFLRATLFARTRSVVLTSATISAAGSFAFLMSSLGIDDAQQLVAPSPFDYARQARLYVAPPKLNPKAADFARRAAPLIEEILDRTAGRAFVLFTSYARMREVYGLLRERLAFPTKVQGDLPRSALLDWFRSTRTPCCSRRPRSGKGSTSSATRCRASSSTGCRFPSPSEPLVAARIAALEARDARASSTT
jgi:ATP-dependent DNA helicase DinG